MKFHFRSSSSKQSTQHSNKILRDLFPFSKKRTLKKISDDIEHSVNKLTAWHSCKNTPKSSPLIIDDEKSNLATLAPSIISYQKYEHAVTVNSGDFLTNYESYQRESSDSQSKLSSWFIEKSTNNIDNLSSNVTEYEQSSSDFAKLMTDTINNSQLQSLNTQLFTNATPSSDAYNREYAPENKSNATSLQKKKDLLTPKELAKIRNRRIAPYNNLYKELRKNSSDEERFVKHLAYLHEHGHFTHRNCIIKNSSLIIECEPPPSKSQQDIDQATDIEEIEIDEPPLSKCHSDKNLNYNQNPSETKLHNFSRSQKNVCDKSDLCKEQKKSSLSANKTQAALHDFNGLIFSSTNEKLENQQLDVGSSDYINKLTTKTNLDSLTKLQNERDLLNSKSRKYLSVGEKSSTQKSKRIKKLKSDDLVTNKGSNFIKCVNYKGVVIVGLVVSIIISVVIFSLTMRYANTIDLYRSLNSTFPELNQYVDLHWLSRIWNVSQITGLICTIVWTIRYVVWRLRKQSEDAIPQPKGYIWSSDILLKSSNDQFQTKTWI